MMRVRLAVPPLGTGRCVSLAAVLYHALLDVEGLDQLLPRPHVEREDCLPSHSAEFGRARFFLLGCCGRTWRLMLG